MIIVFESHIEYKSTASGSFPALSTNQCMDSHQFSKLFLIKLFLHFDQNEFLQFLIMHDLDAGVVWDDVLLIDDVLKEAALSDHTFEVIFCDLLL